MWAQAQFRPDDFWRQTPLHFQLAMRGVRKRLEAESEAQMAQAYQGGAFAGLAHHGKLKSLDHYRNRGKRQTAEGMVNVLRSLGAKSNMKIRRIRIEPVNDEGEA